MNATRNAHACAWELCQRKLETFNFCDAMCVPQPLEYMKNGGSSITYRPH